MSETVTITRPVAVKVRVTEKYKKFFIFELQAAVQKLELQLNRFDYEINRVTLEIKKQKSEQLEIAWKKMSEERAKCLETRKKLVEKIKEISKLKPGDEVKYSKVESIAEVHVGDKWKEVMNKEIILEDDIIVEIRTSDVGKDIGDG